MRKLDRYTLGKTPAAIYLIDTLNQMDRRQSAVLKPINDFRFVLHDMVNAVNRGDLTLKALTSFCSLKRDTLDAQCERFTGIDPLVIDLFRNIILGDIKRYTRIATKFKAKERSLRDKTRNVLEKYPAEDYPITILMDSVPVHVSGDGHIEPDLKFESIQDDITYLTLQEKSRKKLGRLGKKNTFY